VSSGSKPAYLPGTRPVRKIDWLFEPAPPEGAGAPPESGPAANAAGRITPRVIDTESEEFRSMWSRLSAAASEVVSDDELGMTGWLQRLVKEARGGGQVGPELLVGPRGLSAGDPALLEPSAPLALSPVDQLLSQQDGPPAARRRQLQELAFQEKAGPPGEDEWLTS
jgi:hypothetical protein